MATVRIGRQRPVTVYDRRRAARAALTAAAGTPIVPGYDLTHGSLADQRFLELANQAGHPEVLGDSWPCEAMELGDIPRTVFRDGSTVVLVTPDGAVVKLSLDWGWFSVKVAAGERETAQSVCGTFRAAYPASYLQPDDPDSKVPITFWTNGTFGPVPRLRRIEASSWGSIEGNYTSVVQVELGEIMGWREPERDGQLFLWQGPPGTGKTWALRALASEWARWAEFHYITDPDAFFVSEPSYMIDVLLADSYAAIERETGDVFLEDAGSKWRVLILEDTGELLAANAKRSYGQGLSRLLNVVDGMIGQGLRVLALVTTNDELGSLHPAVARPGRCASQLVFGPLDAAEASVFLGRDVDEGGTLAELYAMRDDPVDALPETVEPMTAAIDDREQAQAFADLVALAASPLPPVEAGDRTRYRHPE